MFNLILLALAALLIIFSPPPAQAAFKVCNKGDTPVNVAIVSHVGFGNTNFGEWHIAGWSPAEPGKCTVPIANLESDTYYVGFFRFDQHDQFGAVISTPEKASDFLQSSNAAFCVSWPDAFERQGGIKFLKQCPEGYKLARFSLYISSPACKDERGDPVYTQDLKRDCFVNLTYSATPREADPVVPLTQGPPVDLVAEKVRTIKYRRATAAASKFKSDIQSAMFNRNRDIPSASKLIKEIEAAAAGEGIDVDQIAYEVEFPLPVSLLEEEILGLGNHAWACMSCGPGIDQRIMYQVRNLKDPKFIKCVYGPYDNGSEGFREYILWHKNVMVTRDELVAITPKHPLLRRGFQAIDQCPETPDKLDAMNMWYQQYSNYDTQVSRKVRYMRDMMAWQKEPQKYSKPAEFKTLADPLLTEENVLPFYAQKVIGKNIWSMSSADRNFFQPILEQWETVEMLECRYSQPYDDNYSSIIFWKDSAPESLVDALDRLKNREDYRYLTQWQIVDKCPKTKHEAQIASKQE